jgi:hypothetical protein
MNAQQQAARDRAVKVLQHYVETLFAKAGASASYSRDVAIEVEGIVDDIITAATPPAQTEHEAAVEEQRRRERDLPTQQPTRLDIGL